MDAPTPRPQLALPPRRKGPPTPLHIDTPVHNPGIALFASDSSASTSALSSTTSDADSFILPSPSKPRSLRNMKKLSITLPSAQSSTNSLTLPAPDARNAPPSAPDPSILAKRRPSVISLPNTSTHLLRRKGEDGDGSPTVAYADGPIQILPGVWLGSEDNVRDWTGLRERGIKSILNVAKEVQTDFDQTLQPLRPFMSTPDLNAAPAAPSSSDSTYRPAHLSSGRPAMHYLKLHWSHGQSDLVTQGFPAAFAFVDQAADRGDGVLIHCQCGVSRSATLVIALVMRAAAQRSPNVPSEVWALKGMQEAYSFVKEKSKHVGPNMSLIYQLLDYERALKGGNDSPTPSEISAEEEWSRRRLAMETDGEDDRESVEMMAEAKALDQAMEDRILARKTSSSSLSSTGTGQGIGMGAAWRSKYGPGRKRKGSVASILTNGSVLSEDLVEEDEEPELLGINRGFDGVSFGARSPSAEPTEDETSGDSAVEPNPPQSACLTARPSMRRPPGLSLPPSAPAHKSSFVLPPVPATAIKSSFDLTPRANRTAKPRRRPPPLGILPAVPASPIIPVNSSTSQSRPRTESRKPKTPPAHLRLSLKSTPPKTRPCAPLATPSQTLFVFPPSPTLATTRTPSTLTLTSNTFPFPTMATPRVSAFRGGEGRRKSFIGLATPVTPTVASSRVDVRGFLA